MSLTGEMLIGQSSVAGSRDPIHAINPSTGEQLEPGYLGGTAAEVDRAAQLAWDAFDQYRETSLDARARFLETIAGNVEALGDELLTRVMAETGLPRGRVEAELARTCKQLRLFADVVRSGEWLDVRIDSALPERQPIPRVDMRSRQIPLGPVVVFGASNFPLAFSVAGGDTSSALAAGCPVIVKAHSAHPGTSELVGRAVQKAVAECGMPEGVFSVLFGSGREVGAKLVADNRIKAVGFTGSFSGGTALMAIAQQRNEPIPVYAEMSSSNPVFLLPSALSNRGEALADGFVSTLTTCAGQYCTSPGLLIAEKGQALNTFITTAAAAINQSATQTMLTPGIYDAYEHGVTALSANPRVRTLAHALASDAPNQCRAALFAVSARDFMEDDSLHDEVFGSAALVVECNDQTEVLQVAECLEGQLTATLQLDEADLDAARKLMPILERKVGRVLVNGWPPGLEVGHTTVHGGPFPSTSDSRTTSVGSAAIVRFLRPVCYQAVPDNLLPDALKERNPLQLKRLYDGKWDL
ncbi:Ketoglutarate semialdehyde dehydrogenase [Marinobacterium lacunae]|uniref:2,5-dioxovalerate dehydrogenase n=1 Tax=Marinobacterium lacunae TaxID=1232683 RepID=A0A081FUL4_9GAMM|nr:aldehyde dehydrogenase (NADP(+)) [Marinobacterium lacunae]KEA62219.1 Ketoglutarate semialdehyde dehydrogenase [Marinobacterium lacunae]